MKKILETSLLENRFLKRWESLGTGSSLLASGARLAVYAMLLFLAFECVTIDFRWPEQAVLGVLTILITLAIHSISASELVTLALMFASMLATTRYAYWRISTVAEAFFDRNHPVAWIDAFFMLVLLSAEVYAFVILYLGYIQTIRPLRRPPVPLPSDVEEWPDVDVLIPTYNEPLSVVRSTAFAAMNIDYPADKLHVYVLDDGRREEFRKFCKDAEIGYMIRPDNKHAKAGNINHALRELTSPYVAIFDCDHVPTRSFLQVTLGWFLKDKKLGMLQTPHYFYSPDPFERNLEQFMVIPNEGELFYGVIQDGNDLWNATFFCGSCAVLRRTAINEIGGIATETVTEDAHTSLRMQTRGWNTAYINIPQAAGLATESLSSHVGQRIRWARGMCQILRTDNPVFVKGLKWPQRLCYVNAMIHFLYAGPRLIFLTAPLIYMLLGRINIPGYWAAILAYAMPHLFLSNVTNLRVQGKYRYSFWNEVYETVLAPYILGPTLLALVNPKLGKFNVTAKGGIVEKKYFDARIARPYLVMIWLSVLGLLIAPIRILYWNAGHPGTIAMNCAWILFNLVILGTANAVAIESKQVREDVRIGVHLPVEIRMPDGRSVFGESMDVSLGGAALVLEEPLNLPPGSALRVIYPLRKQQAAFPATVVGVAGKNLRLKYEELTIEEEELLTLVLYSRADTWLSRSERRQNDRPLRSFARLVQLSVRGVGYALLALIPKRKKSESVAPATRTQAAAIIIAMLLCGGAWSLHAQARAGGAPAPAAPVTSAGSFHSAMSLKDMGIPQSIEFRGVDASRGIPFSLANTEVVQQAKLNLHYSFSPGLIPEMSHLNVLLNGTLIASLAAPAKTADVQDALTASIPLPADMLVRNNTLSFQFIGHYTRDCEDPANSVLWARVENNSNIELSGSLLPLSDDLKILPLPFYDDALSEAHQAVPFVFTEQPSNETLQAAGILASWLGIFAKTHALTMPAKVSSTVPQGNVVLFVEKPTDLPPGMDLNISGPTIAMRVNPSDPYGKVLVIAGNDPSQLVTAAQAVALQNTMLQGRTARISEFELPAPREADDAPLWLRTDRISPFWNYTDNAELRSDGSGPLAVYLRVPPDLYYADRSTIPLNIDYRYNAIPLANGSTLRVTANGTFVNELPLPHADNPKKTLSYRAAVPLTGMRPFSNTLLFNFYFQIAKTGHCQDTAPINLQGSILRSSHLDLRGLNHWAAMPNLELFANAGFPFTRFADLSQTMVVMPAAASEKEIGAYLTLMAYFSQQTGYPALRVSVSNSASLGKDLDYLILGTTTDQPAFDRLSGQLPVSVKSDEVTVSDTGGIFASIQHAWWQVAEMRPNWWWKLGQTKERNGLITSLGESPEAVIQGIESPWESNRSVVTIAFRDDNSASAFVSAFLKSYASGNISESVSVLHGTGFSSYRLGDRFYYVGYLPWWSHVRYWLMEFPWLIVVLTFVLGLFVVPWTRARLDRRARARLEAREA